MTAEEKEQYIETLSSGGRQIVIRQHLSDRAIEVISRGRTLIFYQPQTFYDIVSHSNKAQRYLRLNDDQALLLAYCLNEGCDYEPAFQEGE